MSIPEIPTRAVVVYYITNTDNREFAITFPFLSEATNLKCYHRNSENVLKELVYPTEYTVTINDSGTNNIWGKVIVNSEYPLSIGDTIAIKRNIPVDQETTFSNQKVFSSTMDFAIDKLTALIQDMQFENSTIHAPIDEELGKDTLNIGKAQDRANKILGFDSFGNVTLIASSGSGDTERCLRIPLEESPTNLIMYKELRAGNLPYFDDNGSLQWMKATPLIGIETTINETVEIVHKADEKSDTALQTATDAKNESDIAKTTAEAASAAAAGSVTASGLALSTANEAKQTALEAKTTANNVSGVANEALEKADTALTYGKHCIITDKSDLSIKNNTGLIGSLCYGEYLPKEFRETYVMKIKKINNKLFSLGHNGKIYISEEGHIWKEITVDSNSNILNDIVFGNNRYIIAGNDGKIYSSYDGEIWEVEYTGDDKNFIAVASDGDSVLAITLTNIYLSKENGIWQTVKTHSYMHDIVYGNGIYVAIGFDISKLLVSFTISSDGINWSTYWLNEREREIELRSICFDGKKFVAVGGGEKFESLGGGEEFVSVSGAQRFGICFTSSNGKEWTEQNLVDPNKEFREIKYSEGEYLILTDGGSLYRGSDIEQASLSQNFNYSGINSVEKFRGTYFVVGDNGTLLKSSDALTWQQQSYDLSYFNSDYRYIGFLDNKFFAVGTNETVLTSTTGGYSWKHEFAPTEFLSWDIGFNHVLKAFNDDIYILGDLNLNLVSQNGLFKNFSIGSGHAYSFKKGAYSGSLMLVLAKEEDSTVTTIYQSTNGNDWDTINNPATDEINDVAYGNGKFVLVGNNGTILTKEGNGDIQVRSSKLTTANLLGVTYDNNTFVITTSNGHIFTSTNGTDWQDHQVETWNIELEKAVYGGGFWIISGRWGMENYYTPNLKDFARLEAGGPEGSRCGYAYDGVKFVGMSMHMGIQAIRPTSKYTWTTETLDTSMILNDVCLGDNGAIGVGNSGKIIYSSDGFGWTERNSAVAVNLYGVATNGQTYVAVGESGKIIYSTDTTTWNTATSQVSLNNIRGITYSSEDSMFYACGNNSSSGTFALKSTNGINWNLVNIGFNQFDPYGIAVGNGVCAMVTEHGRVLYGGTEESNFNSSNVGVNNDLKAICFDGEKFVAVGTNIKTEKGVLFTSANCVNWNSGNLPENTGGLTGIGYGFGEYRISGKGGLILKSRDGFTWEKDDIEITSDLNCVRYGKRWDNPKFITMGVSGKVASQNISWNYEDSIQDDKAFSQYFTSIGYTKKHVYVAGNDGEVFKTSDFKQIDKIGNLGFCADDMCQGNGKLIVVGKDGRIASSTNGTDWENLESGTLNDLNSVKYGRGKFVVCGNKGTILVSSDGTNFIQKNTGHTAQLRDLCYAYGIFAASGYNGIISVSYDAGETWEQMTVQNNTEITSIVFFQSYFNFISTGGKIYHYKTDSNGKLFANGYTTLAGNPYFGSNMRTDATNFIPMFRSYDGTIYTYGNNVNYHLEVFPQQAWGDIEGRRIKYIPWLQKYCFVGRNKGLYNFEPVKAFRITSN